MALDAGRAAVRGALIGALGTLTAISLTHWLQLRKSSSLADARKARLRGMLSGNKYTWRPTDSLVASIGADEDSTKAILIEIDARASSSNPKSFAMVSSAPWPDDLQPVDDLGTVQTS